MAAGGWQVSTGTAQSGRGHGSSNSPGPQPLLDTQGHLAPSWPLSKLRGDPRQAAAQARQRPLHAVDATNSRCALS